MPKSKQDFFWFELMTTDLDAAVRFYSEVVGWTMTEVGSPGMRYLTGAADQTKRGVVGMMSIPPGMAGNGAHAGWTGYIHAEDVDAAAFNAEQAGAHILRGAEEVPGVGRMALLSDPQGAVFHLMQPKPHGEPPPAPDANAVGSVGWYELGALNWQEEWDFYAGQFGWTKAEAMDMGEMGVYQMFATTDQPMTGGMMTVPEPMRQMTGNRASWMFYFVVDSIGKAKDRAEKAGARITNGPMQVPGDIWVVQGMDPQGAAFALMSMQS